MLALRTSYGQGACRTSSVRLDSASMETKVDVRLPRELRRALERERLRMSKALGAEVKTSFVVRSLLERALHPKRRPAAIERAA